VIERPAAKAGFLLRPAISQLLAAGWPLCSHRLRGIPLRPAAMPEWAAISGDRLREREAAGMAKRSSRLRNVPLTDAEIAMSDAALELEKQRAYSNAGRRAKFLEIARELFPDLTLINHGDGGDGDPLLTLDQIGREVFKRDFRKWRHLLPAADVPAHGRHPNLWRWSRVRPVLVRHFPKVKIPDHPFGPSVQ